jgi:hypothetical protein
MSERSLLFGVGKAEEDEDEDRGEGEERVRPHHKRSRRDRTFRETRNPQIR